MIWADEHGREIGFVGKCEGDFTIGLRNSFAMTVEKRLGIRQGCYLMLDGTEFGGMVDGYELDTDAGVVTLTGPTWHGLLAAQIIEPDAGSAYYVESGEANEVIGRLLARIGLTERMAAAESDSGFSVEGHRFSRVSTQMDAYTGIRDMLRGVDAKLRILYDSELRKAVLSAVPVSDYTDDGIDGDKVAFHLRETRTCNHLHCMGIGEGASRTIIDLYADDMGRISKTQSIFGMAHRCQVYEASSSDAEALEADGRKKLADMLAETSSCNLIGADDGRYDIDDIVGGTSTDYGKTVVTTVAQKTATVTGEGISYETLTALEATQ